MSTPVKLKKKFYYKRAEFLLPPGKSLQELILEARGKHKGAKSREVENSGIIRVWNNHTLRGKMDLGMLHAFQRGASQLLLTTGEEDEEYEILEALPPAPKEKNKTNEFNEGVLFFGLFRDHVIVLQSGSVRVSHFSDYLNALLSKAGLLEDNYLRLKDPLPLDLRKVDAPPLNAITIHTPFHVKPVETDSIAKTGKVKKKDMRLRVDKAIWGPVQELLRSVGAVPPDDLDFDGSFKAGLVELNLEFRWKGRKRDRDKTPVLDTILNAFQDVDDPPIVAEGADGSKIKGNNLRTHKSAWIDSINKNLVYTDVYKHMQEYLAELLKSGEIPP